MNLNGCRQLVELPTGVSLETEVIRPQNSESVQEGSKLAVFLHSWSWLGGQMDDPVLESLIDPLHARNYYVLRFNSRGVGKSTGQASFTGFNEAKDLEAITQMAMQEINDVRSVVIVGYSHGSLIASLHPILPPPVKTSHVLLSYPLSPRGWLTLFRTSYYAKKLEELVCNTSSNVLVLFGDHDEFTSVSKYKAWAHELQGYLGADKSLTVVEVPGGSHFWRRAGQELGGELEQWLP